MQRSGGTYRAVQRWSGSFQASFGIRLGSVRDPCGVRPKKCSTRIRRRRPQPPPQKNTEGGLGGIAPQATFGRRSHRRSRPLAARRTLENDVNQNENKHKQGNLRGWREAHPPQVTFSGRSTMMHGRSIDRIEMNIESTESKKRKMPLLKEFSRTS